jgi:tRNA U34 5-methylaminomethyl-2-thiouridine-forming methyltransferase MnmC
LDGEGCTPAMKRTGRNALFSAGVRMENGALGKRICHRVGLKPQ